MEFLFNTLLSIYNYAVPYRVGLSAIIFLCIHTVFLVKRSYTFRWTIPKKQCKKVKLATVKLNVYRPNRIDK